LSRGMKFHEAPGFITGEILFYGLFVVSVVVLIATNFNFMLFMVMIILTVVISVVGGYKVSKWYIRRNSPGGLQPGPQGGRVASPLGAVTAGRSSSRPGEYVPSAERTPFEPVTVSLYQLDDAIRVGRNINSTNLVP